MPYWQEILEQNIGGMAEEADVEVIFVNDYPDKNIDINVTWREEYHARIINHAENLGIHGTRVEAIKAAAKEYVVLLDQDDRIAPNYIESQLKCIGRNDAVLCNGYLEYGQMNVKKKIYSNKFQQEEAPATTFDVNKIISPGQVVIKKESIPGIWMENIMRRNGSDDYFLWLAMNDKHCSFAVNEEMLYTHVWTGNNASGNHLEMMASYEEALDILKRNGIRYPSSEQRYKKMSIDFSKYYELSQIYDTWLYLKNRNLSLEDYLVGRGYNRIAVYGMSYLGNRVCDEFANSRIEVAFVIDKEADRFVADIPIYGLDKIEDRMKEVDLVLVTVLASLEPIKKVLNKNSEVPVISVKDILYEISLERQ